MAGVLWVKVVPPHPPWGKAASPLDQLHGRAVAAALGAAEPPLFLFSKPDSVALWAFCTCPNSVLLLLACFKNPVLIQSKVVLFAYKEYPRLVCTQRDLKTIHKV